MLRSIVERSAVPSYGMTVLLSVASLKSYGSVWSDSASTGAILSGTVHRRMATSDRPCSALEDGVTERKRLRGSLARRCKTP